GVARDHRRRCFRLAALAWNSTDYRRGDAADRISEELTASAAAEEPLDVAELQLHICRAAVVALTGERRRLHLSQERVHLVRRQAPPRADAAMAGHRRANRFEPLLERLPP